MKPSRYNYSTHMPDGTTLLFNFYTLNLLSLNKSDYHSVSQIIRDPGTFRNNEEGSDLFKLLSEKGFIIGDSIDEFNLLKQQRKILCENEGQLSLTIVPSLACNFQCIYCYQKEDPQRMSRQVKESILNFVRAKIQRRGSLSVDWFGGEPLLQMKTIQRLSKGFMEICEKYDAEYSAGIVTNGYLFKKEIVERLVELKVKRAQITLDGPPEIHNKRRPHKGAKKTFETILQNLKEVADMIQISLRMNIDKENRNAIKAMLDILVTEGLEKRIGFYLGKTYPYTDVCADISASCLNDADFSLLGLEILMELLNRGFAYSYWIPSSKSYMCTADRSNSFVISPSGGIVNCWNETAKPEEEIGHLLKPTTNKMNDNALSWGQCDPFDREDCTECVLLPMCSGGCPYMFKTRGKSECHNWKHNLNESIACYYYFKVIERDRKFGQQVLAAIDAIKQLQKAAETKEDRG